LLGARLYPRAPRPIIASYLEGAILNVELINKFLETVFIITHQFVAQLYREGQCNINVRLLKVREQNDEYLFTTS
jgi:hypothetical protein